MEIYKRYPRGYISFLGRLEISPKNMIVENALDKETDFVSRFFTPHSSIGELSRKMLESIQAREIRTSSRESNYNSLGYLVLHSSLLETHPNLKPYLQAILLEALAIEIAINHVPELREFMNEKDIEKVRENISYTLDIISVDPRYTMIIEHLHDLYVILGYMQAQVPAIKEDMEADMNG